MIIPVIPHAFSGLVGIVPPELRNSETSFQEERGEAQQLHKEREAEEEEGHHTPHHGEEEEEIAVVREVSPPPEIPVVEI